MVRNEWSELNTHARKGKRLVLNTQAEKGEKQLNHKWYIQINHYTSLSLPICLHPFPQDVITEQGFCTPQYVISHIPAAISKSQWLFSPSIYILHSLVHFHFFPAKSANQDTWKFPYGTLLITKVTCRVTTLALSNWTPSLLLTLYLSMENERQSSASLKSQFGDAANYNLATSGKQLVRRKFWPKSSWMPN